MSNTYSKTRILVECALMIALSTVLSMIKIIQMPYGGGVTPLSMLPIILVSFRHGTRWGLLTSFVDSVLQLILGLNNLVPGIGIARGSKIEYFLSRFGLTTAGTTDALDLPRLTESVEWALAHQDEFRQRAASVRAGLLADLDRAKALLEQVLTSP